MKQPFDIEAFWRDKKYKKYVVYLWSRAGKVPKSKDGSYNATYNVQARTAERAIEVAKIYCTVLAGTIYGSARLATPEDLDVKWSNSRCLNA